MAIPATASSDWAERSTIWFWSTHCRSRGPKCCQTSDDNERALPVRTKSLQINFIVFRTCFKNSTNKGVPQTPRRARSNFIRTSFCLDYNQNILAPTAVVTLWVITDPISFTSIYISVESRLARLQRRTIDSIDRLDFSLASRLDSTPSSNDRLDRSTRSISGSILG